MIFRLYFFCTLVLLYIAALASADVDKYSDTKEEVIEEKSIEIDIKKASVNEAHALNETLNAVLDDEASIEDTVRGKRIPKGRFGFGSGGRRPGSTSTNNNFRPNTYPSRVNPINPVKPSYGYPSDKHPYNQHYVDPSSGAYHPFHVTNVPNPSFGRYQPPHVDSRHYSPPSANNQPPINIYGSAPVTNKDRALNILGETIREFAVQVSGGLGQYTSYQLINALKSKNNPCMDKVLEKCNAPVVKDDRGLYEKCLNTYIQNLC